MYTSCKDKKEKNYLLSLIIFLVINCAGSPVIIKDGYEFDRDYYLKEKNKIYKRASYELNCPKEQLKLTILGVLGEYHGWITQVGVEGCMRKAVYINPYPHTSWVLNSVNGEVKRNMVK